MNKVFYLYVQDRFNMINRNEFKDKLNDALKNHLSNVKILNELEILYLLGKMLNLSF